MSRATSSTYTVPFRRKREGKTDYRKRVKYLMFGERLVVRKTGRYVLAQVIAFDEKGDRVISQAHSKELAALGWKYRKNLPTAYLVGYLAGKRALEKGVKRAVLDLGRRTPTRAMFAFAALKGAVDAGLEVPHSEEIIDMDRFRGKHIQDYRKVDITKEFEEVLNKIKG